MIFQSTTERTKYRKKIQSSKVQLYRLHRQHTSPYLEKLAKTDFLVLCLYFICKQCSASHSHCSPSVIEIIFDLFFFVPALETDDTQETSFPVVILRADCKQMINKAKKTKMFALFTRAVSLIVIKARFPSNDTKNCLQIESVF